VNDSDEASRFAAMYCQTRSQVYAYAVTKAGRQLAEEVVSEVFLVAWRRFGDVPDPPLPWLLVTARNVAASQLRSTARERSLAAELQAWIRDAELVQDDVAEQVIDRITILSALARLPERDRETLTLAAWHGLHAKAAARVTGCSTAAYFVKLHRARRRLELAVAVTQQEARQGPAARSMPRSPAKPASPADPANPAGPAGSATRPRPGAPTASPGRALPGAPGRPAGQAFEEQP
jgi:RNA polymerase sigma-70 factor (ECF subfamily)